MGMIKKIGIGIIFLVGASISVILELIKSIWFWLGGLIFLSLYIFIKTIKS